MFFRDIVFTKNQQTGYLDEKIQALKKPLITIFVSSDDEYRYLGSDFGKEPIVDQIDSIYTLVSSSVKDNYDFVVKMHPNQNKSHKSILKKYNSTTIYGLSPWFFVIFSFLIVFLVSYFFYKTLYLSYLKYSYLL